MRHRDRNRGRNVWGMIWPFFFKLACQIEQNNSYDTEGRSMTK